MTTVRGRISPQARAEHGRHYVHDSGKTTAKVIVMPTQWRHRHWDVVHSCLTGAKTMRFSNSYGTVSNTRHILDNPTAKI
ncbi:hypothetical protein ElyMa_005427000 [Elysia marginata]|uniref:Uncharacterized protein n=1 Tax=Elysia marginata TaxID=1093978 RepID=A0AAV4EJL7_9GAST|nr:hypothetical protein ElyMa_005427000 [Elysia marginata]